MDPDQHLPLARDGAWQVRHLETARLDKSRDVHRGSVLLSWRHGSAERGALLRREGLYSSHLAEWRKARDAGVHDALAPRARPRRSAEQVELDKVRHRNERLEAELARTKLALEITGKAHALLELLSKSADSDSESKP